MSCWRRPPSENPPIGKSNKKKIMKIPIEPIERYDLAVFSERKRAKTFDPSKGGIGKRLKIPNIRL